MGSSTISIFRHHGKDISAPQKTDKISYVDSWKLGEIMDLGINGKWLKTIKKIILK